MAATASRIAIALVVLVAGSIVLAGGIVIAGDTSVVFGTNPGEVPAAPGETVTMDLTINTAGDHLGNGLREYTYTLRYHPEYLAITEVEHGTYLEGTGHEAETDHQENDGAVTVTHRINAREDGVTGDGVTATITIAIDEEAPPSDVVIGYTDVDGAFVSDQPISSFPRNGTVVIDSGGDEIAHEDWNDSDDDGDDPPPDDDGTAPDDSDDDADDDDGVGVITPDDDRDGDTGEDAQSDDDEGGDDSIPGFGFLAALAATGVAGWGLRLADQYS